MIGEARQRLEYLSAVYGPALARRIFRDLLWRVDCNHQPILYLTFDDGPTPHLTPQLLRTLETNHVRATFFLLGKHVDMDRDAVPRIEHGGHTVGLHGYDHLDAWRTDPSVVLADLDRGLDLLSSLSSADIRYFRPPFGRFRAATRRWARERGLQIVMWDVMPGDFMTRSSETLVVERVRRRVRPGSVIVLHDSWNPNVVRSTAAAVESMIPLLKAEGWEFESLQGGRMPNAPP